jgi:hypothetical protein
MKVTKVVFLLILITCGAENRSANLWEVSELINIRSWVTAHITLLSLLMIAIGIILMLIGKNLPQGVIRDLLESFGVLFVSVFFISLLYEKFLAEKHFAQFKEVMEAQLLAMDNLQSLCTRLGIREIFENRNDYERKYPLDELLSKVKVGGKLLVVARTMYSLLNKQEAIKHAIKKGVNIQLACIAPTSVDSALATISFLKISDIKTPMEVLEDLLSWVQKEKPSGTLELHTYEQPLPDSLLYVDLEDRSLVVWDMTFGRDSTHKRVFILEPTTTNLGTNLLDRYIKIFDLGKVCVKVNSGGITVQNDLRQLINDCK